MNLSYLPLLVEGLIPNERNYQILNDTRKAKVSAFIVAIPSNYDVSCISADVNNLNSLKDTKLYKFVNYFIPISIVFSFIIALAYIYLFGFWWGIITSAILITVTIIIDPHLGGLFDLSKESIRLHNDYTYLLQILASEQEKENKQK